MSIPPLVCSTPPPPDQCEEDKDPDDFDIPYNLSQDDDDDSFGYGNFSSYSHYQSNHVVQEKEMSINENNISLPKAKQTELYDNNETYSEEKHHNIGTTVSETKPKSEEDVNIEDLGLEVNEVSVSSSEKEDELSEVYNFNVNDTVHVLDVRNDSCINEIPLILGTEKILDDILTTAQYKETLGVEAQNEGSLEVDLHSNGPNTSSSAEDGKIEFNIDEITSEKKSPVEEVSNYYTIKETVCQKDLSIEETVFINDLGIDETVCINNLKVKETVCEEDTTIEDITPRGKSDPKMEDTVYRNALSNEDISKPDECNLDDDFGDFDDFQFASTERKASDVIENCDNPWNSNEVEDNDEFGNFTANFETIEHHNIQTVVISSDKEKNYNKSVFEKDDFGDFDDFQSSVVDNGVRELSLESGCDQSLPIINFHAADSEHQVIESITKVLSSVFELEVLESDSGIEYRLETMLGETWGHLRETDVRQPYIINWNNSLGQKTLLRALCIDSRNILFGPKWGYNMPKYAVNLSAAPLQPQKPMTPSNLTQIDTVAEKIAPKLGQGGWTDPFMADGQESCNTERESVVEVTATDLDVFEAAISSKPDKIYSSTLNVQPLRQISLPDTHIFTPTDSETPTSKTVHYDSGPPILLAQTLVESKQTASSTTPHANNPVQEKMDDDDYWDFQDYKSTSDKISVTPMSSSQLERPSEVNPVLNPNVTYQTQVLQPIRMEPLIPTVNWPDPGDIKETFDDFSDFVSNSTCSDKPREQASIPAMENKSAVENNVLDKINDKHKNMQEIDARVNNDDFDDDFDTFQSALPPKHIASGFKFNSLETLGNIPTHNSTQIADFEHAFPKINNDTISINNTVRPNEAVALNQNTLLNSSNKNSPLSSNSGPKLLQPTSSSSSLASQTKQKTGQILQPLSLESYSQINWPNPGIDLQDLSRFNPVETLQSLKTDLSVGGISKGSSPVHNQKNAASNQLAEDDIWGEFVSSKPKQHSSMTKKPSSFPDDDEWTDFVSSTVKPHNGLNTISLNVHTNSNIQKSNSGKFSKNNQPPFDIPSLNYITPKTSGHSSLNDRHFQNL